MAPGEPLNLTVDSTGPTSANLCWQEPQETGQPGISHYTIIATDENDDEVTANTPTNATRFTMTGLLPNLAYQFRVQAVAMALEVKNSGDISEPASGMTTTTGIVCGFETKQNSLLC